MWKVCRKRNNAIRWPLRFWFGFGLDSVYMWNSPYHDHRSSFFIQVCAWFLFLGDKLISLGSIDKSLCAQQLNNNTGLERFKRKQRSFLHLRSTFWLPESKDKRCGIYSIKKCCSPVVSFHLKTVTSITTIEVVNSCQIFKGWLQKSI